MSRDITAEEVAKLTGRDNSGPYTPTIDQSQFIGDPDEPESWFYTDMRLGADGKPKVRPQKRTYQIIGRDGEPTGRLVYARNEIQAAALRQELRDSKGVVYQPAARLVDIIYLD